MLPRWRSPCIKLIAPISGSIDRYGSSYFCRSGNQLWESQNSQSSKSLVLEKGPPLGVSSNMISRSRWRLIEPNNGKSDYHMAIFSDVKSAPLWIRPQGPIWPGIVIFWFLSSSNCPQRSSMYMNTRWLLTCQPYSSGTGISSWSAFLITQRHRASATVMWGRT
jgi:hypothetical protein